MGLLKTKEILLLSPEKQVEAGNGVIFQYRCGIPRHGTFRVFRHYNDDRSILLQCPECKFLNEA